VTGPKTNERPRGARAEVPGTKAVLRHARLSPYKVREVLDLVRGKPVHEAEDILRFSERGAAFTVGKVLRSAVANAQNNDELDPEELYVSACFADEGTTIKRWRPRARGRATRIRKRSCHITVIVSRLPDRELARLQQRRRTEQLAQRARRVAAARRAEGDTRNRAERRRGLPPPEEEVQEPEVDAGAEGAPNGVVQATEPAEQAAEATEQGAEATEQGAEATEQGDEAAEGQQHEATEGEPDEAAGEPQSEAAGTAPEEPAGHGGEEEGE
jgi:large subunit ribosomal protein L22